MRTDIALLSLLALLLISAQPALSARFSIYAYDRDNNNALIPDAEIKIWQDSNLLDSGKTDGDGVFVTYLDYGGRYRIRAEYSNKWEEINDFLASIGSGDRISLYLYEHK